MPFCADHKRRFDTTLRALLAVKKTDLLDIEEKLKAVQTELKKRQQIATRLH